MKNISIVFVLFLFFRSIGFTQTENKITIFDRPDAVINDESMRFTEIENIYEHQRFWVSVHLGVAVPVLDLYNDLSLGFNGGADLIYRFNNKVFLTLSTGYYYWGPKFDLPDDISFHYTAVPVMLGIRYCFDKVDYKPYIGVEAGYCFVNSSVNVEMPESEQSACTNQSKFGYSPIIGLTYYLSYKMDLDLNFKYNFIKTKDVRTQSIGVNLCFDFAI
jgi:hypothetical protein